MRPSCFSVNRQPHQMTSVLTEFAQDFFSQGVKCYIEYSRSDSVILLLPNIELFINVKTSLCCLYRLLATNGILFIRIL